MKSMFLLAWRLPSARYRQESVVFQVLRWGTLERLATQSHSTYSTVNNPFCFEITLSHNSPFRAFLAVRTGDATFSIYKLEQNCSKTTRLCRQPHQVCRRCRRLLPHAQITSTSLRNGLRRWEESASFRARKGRTNTNSTELFALSFRSMRGVWAVVYI